MPLKDLCIWSCCPSITDRLKVREGNVLQCRERQVSRELYCLSLHWKTCRERQYNSCWQVLWSNLQPDCCQFGFIQLLSTHSFVVCCILVQGWVQERVRKSTSFWVGVVVKHILLIWLGLLLLANLGLLNSHGLIWFMLVPTCTLEPTLCEFSRVTQDKLRGGEVLWVCVA